MPGAARSGCRTGRPRTTGASRARPRSGGWGDPSASNRWQSASSRRRPAAGWALRAGRKSSSTPRWTLAGPSSNQQPPRTASSGGFGTRGGPAVRRRTPRPGPRPPGRAAWPVARGRCPRPGTGPARHDRPRSSGPAQVPPQGVVGGHLHQVDAEAVGVVDPGLDQAPRLERGRSDHGARPGRPARPGCRRGPHLQPQGHRSGAARLVVRSTAGVAPDHLDEPAAGEEHHASMVPVAELPGHGQSEAVAVEGQGPVEVAGMDDGPAGQHLHVAPSFGRLGDRSPRGPRRAPAVPRHGTPRRAAARPLSRWSEAARPRHRAAVEQLLAGDQDRQVPPDPDPPALSASAGVSSPLDMAAASS